ncbi:MAG TPA: cellulose synthase family protein, partial [Candidatus Polarisedimenticolia bacterium]|nr:cellulose synthase family protein [Candidatus Polarisedimenticolia bacterium]
MNPVEIGIVALYLAILTILALYGGHRAYLLYLYRRHRGERHRVYRLDSLPPVTVQLPIYNERYVVERLIRAVCALDYPRDRLEIQVLDDSDDGTSRIAARMIAEMRGRGHDIRHLRRGFRSGYKAGALAHGLRQARGEMIAIFDADFVPEPGYLLDLIHAFGNPRVGMVQARWGHMNRDYSRLTRIQAILLDGHFVIEHAARHLSGRFFNFNGTAGIWRRACIESAGGWQADTLTEDLDLSYRAQLMGWQFEFAPDVVVPAELPADIDAVRAQQRRWARGSIETARKILPRLLRARLPLGAKVEALFHLTANASYPLLVALSLLIVPATIVRQKAGLTTLALLDLPLVLLSTLSISAFYLAGQREIGRSGRSAARLLPGLMTFGIGLAVSNARGVLLAFSRRSGEFVRTPKHDLRGTRGGWRLKDYRAPRSLCVNALEVLLGVYFTGAALYAALAGMAASLPVLVLFQMGFFYRSALQRRS